MDDMMKKAMMQKKEHPLPENMQVARQIAEEGIVLLKNDGVLPLAAGSKVALFGAGAVDTVISGTGSGKAFAPYEVNVRDGLKNAGFEVTSEGWLERFAAASKKANDEDKTLSMIDRMWSGLKILIDEIPVTDEDLRDAGEASTAIYVIRRNAGEGHDRRAEKGDYYLSDMERGNIAKVAAAFDHTVVVLNTCMIDANFLYEIPGVDAAVFMGLPGNEAGNALAHILTGETNPSGRLTDTWAVDYHDYPASATFSFNDGDTINEDYCEDIYVGYRWFDTKNKPVIFPFGYGLSYTSFAMKPAGVKADFSEIAIDVEVTNTGDTAGREVVEVYVSAPQGRLAKPYQELRGFAKTSLLAACASETVQIRIPTERLASYDEACAAWVMEAGDYQIRIGRDSRHTDTACILRLDAEAVVRQVSNKMHPDHELDLVKITELPQKLSAPVCDTAETAEVSFGEPAVAELHAADCVTIDNVCATAADQLAERKSTHYNREVTFRRCTAAYPSAGADAADMTATLPDVVEGRVTYPAFVNSLDEEVLLRLITGDANETPYEVPVRMKREAAPVQGPKSSGATTSLFAASLGIPNWLVTDGPAGLHLPMCGTTCWPGGINLAQTWDPECAKKMGTGIGRELTAYNYSVILGPGMNIHRDPLCGRNFEYYSEDPLISGVTAAAETEGVQSNPGCAVSVKHFCANSQEEDRNGGMNATISERALREIYLRGFEICVREAQPKTIMTSYNLVNGMNNTSNYELLTEMVRGEWGFRGMFMSDWGVNSDKTADIAAGNDLTMGGYQTDVLKAALHGLAPEFAEDGFVRVTETPIFGGFMTQRQEYWNTFVPSADGADTVTTAVAAGVELNPEVAKLEEQKIAAVTSHEDGSKTVTYHGTSIGQTLYLDDVKRCAERVLRQIADSVSYRVMMK